MIAPRELVMQIAQDAVDLARHTDLQVITLIGGMDYQKQLNRLHNTVVDPVVATPGRLLDFMSRRDLYLDHVEILVLDEADRMLDMGFIPRSSASCAPRRAGKSPDLLFSATFTQDIINLSQQWTYEPITIEIEPDHVATDSVDQKVYLVSSEQRYRVLNNLLRSEDATSVIVFANRRDQVRRLHERLRRSGVAAVSCPGDSQQAKRTSTLEQFKQGEIKVLVATDVAGRGIHVEGVSHVVNYNPPEDPRTTCTASAAPGGRGQRVSISFASEDDAFLLPDLRCCWAPAWNAPIPRANCWSRRREPTTGQLLAPQQGGAHHRGGHHEKLTMECRCTAPPGRRNPYCSGAASAPLP